MLASSGLIIVEVDVGIGSVDLLQQLLDAILAGNRLVHEERQRWNPSEPQPGSYLAAEKRSSPSERPPALFLRPLVTEKGTHQSTRYNAYTFQVNPLATKTEIKAAVEELFHVKVEAVRTQVREGKRRRFRQSMGQLPTWKKAIVTLSGDDKIEFF